VTTAPTAGRAAPRLVLWTALAVGAAVVASALAGTVAVLPVLVGTAVTRAGGDVAGVACVGLALVAVLLPAGAALPGAALRDLARTLVRIDRLVVVVAGAWLLLVLTGVVFRAAEAYGRPVAALDAAEVARFAGQVPAGRGLLLTAGCALAVLGCAAARLRRREAVTARVVLIAALLGVLTPSITGHAGTAPDHQLAVLSVAMHAGAAALWVGGLAVLVVLVARHRALLDAVLPRYSRVAGAAVVTVALTGVVAAAVRVGSWTALVSTGYGLLVVGKAVCLVLLAGLGGLARRRLAAGRAPVLRWAGLEVALMAVTLGLAAALTQSG
jgi:copper resistance protein D